MKALFRGALVYDNGIMKKQDVVFDGVCLSAFDGDVKNEKDTGVSAGNPYFSK
jgi:hypothetical protein